MSLLDTAGRLSNIVFMGMGEPLANYKRVIAAVHRICGIAVRNPWDDLSE